MGVGGGAGALTGPERAPLPPAELLAEQSLAVPNSKRGEGGVSGGCAAGLRASPRDCELLANYLIINRLAKVARQAPEGPEAPEPVRHSDCPKMSGAGGCIVTAELSGTGAGVAGKPSRPSAGASFLETNCPAGRSG